MTWIFNWDIHVPSCCYRSIGCILYELCALEHAFNGQGLMGVMYKIVEGKPPDLPKKYSRDLNKVLQKWVQTFRYMYMDILPELTKYIFDSFQILNVHRTRTCFELNERIPPCNLVVFWTNFPILCKFYSFFSIKDLNLVKLLARIWLFF